jgi:pSer/pThr/pTyr-binding forkhead associated (FHA) protein
MASGFSPGGEAPDSQAKLVGVLPSGETLECPIDRAEVDIGSAPHNHLVLSDPAVSKTHAVILLRQGLYSIVDAGSRNGTTVNGERLGDQARPLRHGDKIKLGQVLLVFRNPSEPADKHTLQLDAEVVSELRRELGRRASARAAAMEAPAPLAPSRTPEGDDAEAPEKRKKKKKDEDRIRAAYINSLSRLLAAVLSVALTVGLTLFLVRSGPPPAGSGAVPAEARRADAGSPLSLRGGSPLRAGAFAPSGTASVAGTDVVLFADRARPQEILWLRVDAAGRQLDAARALPLGLRIDSPASLTYGASYFYVGGSVSKTSASATQAHALARFAFDPRTRTLLKAAEPLVGLGAFLAASIPQLPAAEAPSISGLAWDPIRERLLLGFRSPTPAGRALVVPIKLRNPLGAFAAANLQLADAPVELPLAGGGIRDLHYDARLRAFSILSAADDAAEAVLWQWSGAGSASQAELEPTLRFEPDFAAEGVTHVAAGGGAFMFVVGRSGRYLRADYPPAR